MRIGLFLLLSLAFISVRAQTPEFTQHALQHLSLNPAECGTLGTPILNAIYHKQFTSQPGALSSQYASFHTPIPERNIGLGLWLSHSSFFISQQTNAFATYAYHIKNDEYFLSMGLQAGFTQYDFSFSNVDLLDPDDPAFGSDYNTGILANTGIGLRLATPTYVIGLSVPRLIQHSLEDQGLTSDYLERRSVNVYGLYSWGISHELTLLTHAYLAFTENQSSSYLISVAADIRQTFQGGFTYHREKTWAIFLSAQISENLKIGYAYDFGQRSTAINKVASHEIGVRYAFQSIKENQSTIFTYY